MAANTYTFRARISFLDIKRNVVEKSIIMLFAFAGVVGTSFSFSNPAATSDPQNYNQFSTSQVLLDESEDGKPKFKDFVSIDGRFKVDNDLDFKMLNDLDDGRYIMEMGDGMRIIITQKEFSYAYAAKGKYEIELKRIKRGLVSTVATKKIKIK